MKKVLLAAALGIGLAAPGAHAESAEEIRQQAHSVCMMDVFMLCTSSIPNETSIMSCMQTRRAQLSAPCRQVFDAGMRLSRRGQQTMR